MKHLIIATTPLQAKIAQHIKRLYPNQDFVSLYVSPVKMPVRSIMPRILTMFIILKRQRTWLRFVRSLPATMTPFFMLALTIA